MTDGNDSDDDDNNDEKKNKIFFLFLLYRQFKREITLRLNTSHQITKSSGNVVHLITNKKSLINSCGSASTPLDVSKGSGRGGGGGKKRL